MILFFMLIVLLAIAWGLADHQLQSRIDHQPPPTAMTKPATVVPPRADVAPAAESSPGGNPPPRDTDAAPVVERPVAAQDAAPAPAAPERAAE
jgi:hypothetical protein